MLMELRQAKGTRLSAVGTQHMPQKFGWWCTLKKRIQIETLKNS